MSLSRAVGVGAALVLLPATGCGGDAAPPSKTPATVAPAPAADPGKPNADACSELLLGVAAMNALRKEATSPFVDSTAANDVQTARRSAVAITDFRAGLKRAVDLDKRLAVDADQVDHAIADQDTVLDDRAKTLEANAKRMRDVVGDVQSLRTSFATCGPKKDPDCASKKAVDGALDHVFWNASLLPRSRAEVEKPAFKSADLDAKRAEILKRIDEAQAVLTEDQKRAEAIKATAADQNASLGKSLEQLYAKCALDSTDAADMAVRKTDWITTNEPELRKMVMVVRVVPEGRVRSRLDEWAALSTGVQRDAFEGAARGGFGSGFYVMPRRGEALIVTNRHVVAFGDRATLVLPDGSQMAAEILYSDPKADLAVLKPAKTTVTYGLGLDPAPPKDQQVVIATGYPGLGATPSYQTTRGFVSNQHFVDTFDNAVYIQHTAPVDRGGSGGPLTSERVLVLGVNTLKILERENVAMSVPASAVAEAVVRAEMKPDAEGLRQDARTACLDVVAEVSSVRPRINALFHRISLAMVAESGSTSFNREATADRELSELLLDEPIDALRYAIIDRLIHESRTARLNPYETCATPNPDDWEHIQTMDRVRFQVRAGADTKDLVLRREQGRFQLLRFDLVPAPLDAPKPAKKAKPARKSQAK